MQGGNAWSSFLAGALSSGVGSFADPLLSGLGEGGQYAGGMLLSAGTGAASSAMTGGDPWMGAAIGAIGYATNQAMHKNENKGGYTLKNKTDKTVWVKPEDNALPPQAVKPGQTIYMRIDGVTHPEYPGKVFKVVNKFDKYFGVKVYPWKVQVGLATWPYPQIFNYIGHGGWLSAPPDAGWNAIFQKAGYNK